MPVRHLRAASGALVAAALALGVAALPAQAATTAPPYEPDTTSEVGTITFYDANGAVVTSGSTDASPFAAYAVGSDFPRAGDTQAQLLYANPNPGSQPYNWYREAASGGLYNQLPLTSGPANIQTLSRSHPVAVNHSDDQTLDGFRDDSVHYTGDGYTDTVQIRLRTANATGSAAPMYDSAVLSVDSATHTWTQIYPTPATPATTPGAPTGVTATAGNASATVSWTAPTDDGGSPITGYELQDSTDGGTSWIDTPHSGTTTSQVVSGLTNGTSYLFRVAARNAQGTGDFSAASAAVTPVAPAADSSSLALTGTKAITYGASLTVVGTLKDSATNTALAGQPITLRQRATSAAAFTTVRTVTTSSAGTASVVVKPTANVQYQWSYAGTTTHLAASSAVGGVAVAPSTTIAQNHTSIRRGATVSFYGTVAPVVANQKVYLQRLVGTTYRTTTSYGVVKTQKLPNGRTAQGYVVTLKLTSPGTFRYRAYVPATSTRAAGYSAALTIKVT